MKKLNRPTIPLGEMLPELLRKLGSEASSREQVGAVWERVAGAETARHSVPRRLARGRIMVEVENSAWMHALSLRKEALLQGLVELLGAAKVKGLRFRMGDGKDA